MTPQVEHLAVIVSDLVLVAVLVVAAITDLRSGRIYNWLVYPAVVLGLLLGALDGGLTALGFSDAGAWAGLKDHLLGAGVGFGVLFFCYAIGGMGGGDVKLMAAVGALGGFQRAGEGGGYFIVYAMFYTFAIGAALGILAALWRGALRGTALRCWWGLRMLTLPGTNLDDVAPKKPTIRVPFGFATALGTIWVLVEDYAHADLWSLMTRWF